MEGDVVVASQDAVVLEKGTDRRHVVRDECVPRVETSRASGSGDEMDADPVTVGEGGI